MTRKHFKQLANIVKSSGVLVVRDLLADELADFCARHNSNFDRERFLNACRPDGADQQIRCENHCPKCRSTDIDWFDSDMVTSVDKIQRATCNKCDTEFSEHYKVVYQYTEIE